MRVWIDLSNSPHVPIFRPVVEALRRRGDEVVLTARNHAQTVALARTVWPEIRVIGGSSPAGVAGKAKQMASRSAALAAFARRHRPDVCVSHGSYAQALAGRGLKLPVVTMMDYEGQPANHLSFRLASRVLVPDVFPAAALRRFGCSLWRARRYPGLKEHLALAGFAPDATLRGRLGVGDEILAVMRPPPEGALYHRGVNDRFDHVLEAARATAGVLPLVVPRNDEQRARYSKLENVRTLETPVDGRSLVATADLVVGAGGTMNREAALLGTPTYTLFAGELATVDRLLIDEGAMHDLRGAGELPRFSRRPSPPCAVPDDRAEPILTALFGVLAELA